MYVFHVFQIDLAVASGLKYHRFNLFRAVDLGHDLLGLTLNQLMITADARPDLVRVVKVHETDLILDEEHVHTYDLDLVDLL